MIGILIIAHGTLGESLIQCVTHVMGDVPPLLQALDVTAATQSTIQEHGGELVRQLDQGQGVLLLSDVYGATPCNNMCRLLEPGRVEGIAGVNLPMLIRAVSYRHLPLADVVIKAVNGGKEGVLYISSEYCDATAGS